MLTNRLFEMIYMLIEKERVTASEFAQRFEISVRTVYRDVETLSLSGIPVYASRGKNGGISLLPGFVLNKTLLSQGEKRQLVSALQGFAAVGAQENDAALSKIQALLGTDNQNWIEIDFSGWNGRDRELFSELKQCVLERIPIAFSYHSLRGESSNRQAEPLKLVFKGQGWYLYAFCRMRQDYRFFKLSRMVGIKRLEGTFVRTVPEKVLADRELAPEVKWTAAVMRVDRTQSFRVYDEFPTDSIETLDNGDLLVHFEFPNSEWMTSYVFSFGEYAALLEPEWLRKSMEQKLSAMLKNYN